MHPETRQVERIIADHKYWIRAVSAAWVQKGGYFTDLNLRLFLIMRLFLRPTFLRPLACFLLCLEPCKMNLPIVNINMK